MIQEAYAENVYVRQEPPPPPVIHTENSRFGTWDRRTLEKLAEEATAEIEVLKGELATALAGWRRAVVELTKDK